MQNLFIILIPIIISYVRTESIDFLEVKIACKNDSIFQLDEYILKLGVLGDINSKYPTNEDEAKSHCA